MGLWNPGFQDPSRAREGVGAFEGGCLSARVWVPPDLSLGLWAWCPGLTALWSLLGPGREDRRPGPPPRDHHHRRLFHRYRPGEPGARGARDVSPKGPRQVS